MQRNIRKLAIFVGLPLAAIALAVFLLSWGSGSTKQAQAAPDPAVNLSLSTTGCETSSGATDPPGIVTPGTACSVPNNSDFIVTLNVKAFMAGGYAGYEALVSWTGNVNYSGALTRPSNDGTACGKDPNPSTPGCFYSDFPAGGAPVGTPKPGLTPAQFGNGSVSFGAAQGTEPGGVDPRPPSTYLGLVATFKMTCKQSGTGTITLVASGTDLLAPDLSAHGEAANESVTVTCKPTPATFTPVPTATPPSIPFVQKLPALQNRFLTRQGNKIPPRTCEAGSNGATLTETLGGPIRSLDPKGVTGFQKLAAFEFEMRFDDKMVCVSVVAGPLFSGPAAVCSSVSAKGILRFGCVTIKKNAGIDGPGALAIITVKPQPELFSQLRPNQDNGIPVQILNQGCQLSDEQGHSIPISSCEDADITFRFLEGDVTGPDCLVNVLDTQNIASRWGATKGSLLFNSFLDLSPSGQIKGDGRIDIKDLQFVFGRLNSTCTNPWPAQRAVNPKKP